MIKIKFIYKIIPILIIVVNKLPFLKSDIQGLTPGPVCFIKTGFTNDVLEHELVHSRQFYKMPILFWILYIFQSQRLKFEAEAYAYQAKWIMNNTENDLSIDEIIAMFTLELFNDYNLNYNITEINQIILHYYNK